MQQSQRPAAVSSAMPKLVAAWLLVGIPLAWGIFKTAVNTGALFK